MFSVNPPASIAVTVGQKNSLAELPRSRKWTLYEELARSFESFAGNSQEEIAVLSVYHNVSCRPITRNAEDDMEVLSDLLSWGERYLHHWSRGMYHCSRCQRPLYSSAHKYRGPCRWPSFRVSVSEDAILMIEVYPYNGYAVTVKEVYCGGCELFVGHMFEDAREKGDTHPEAHWRH